MYRYIAFMWNPQNPTESDRVRDLMRRLQFVVPEVRLALTRPGLAAYAVTDSPSSFDICKGAGEDVLVLGKLFHHEMNEDALPAPVVLDASATQAVVRTHGQVLLQRYWGGYVALVHDESTGSTFVVRDPTADVPCCVTRYGETTIVFSCMEDCLALGIPRFSINWQYVAAFLVRPYAQVRQTGLKEVSIVAPGECLEIHLGVERSRAYYWDIARIAADNPIESVGTAAKLARKTICSCVGALAAGHPHIIHHLSGGLDSSTVLAALMHAPSKPRVTCVHHFDEFAGADERNFARMAVEGASASSGRECDLMEYERIPSALRFDRGGPFPRSAFPARYVGYMTMRCIGPETTCDGRAVQFTGHGGDGVFGRFDHEFAAIDYVWRHGLGRQLPRIAFEAAQGRDTFYGVLACAIHRGLLKRNRTLNTFKQALMVNRDVLEAAKSDCCNLVPAWQQACADSGRLSPEKLQHIELMGVPWQSLDPYDRLGPCEWFSPLTSQPVVELFARMPFYVLMADAEERTIPRRAFASDLPAQLLARRTKSYMNGYMFSVIRQHEAFLREIFCDGVLVKQGILDRRILEKTLQTLQGDANSPLIRALIGPQLNLEIWLRGWLGNSQRNPSAMAA